jgi:dethiobiotin synthetase
MGTLLHVVGTDTGVGKTAVAAALVRGLRARGDSPGVCKPFASGDDPARLPADARILLEASGVSDDPALVSPVRFRAPASPWSAARNEGGPGGFAQALEALRGLDALHGILVVEGIGGVAVPLETGRTYLDFLSRAPGLSLVVARDGLGTINHALLTLEALESRNLPVAGVVLNRTAPGADSTVLRNAEAIETFSSAPVLGVLPFLETGPADLVLPGPVHDALRPR